MMHERTGKAERLQSPQYDRSRVLDGWGLEENKAREVSRHQIMEGNACEGKKKKKKVDLEEESSAEHLAKKSVTDPDEWNTRSQ
ncbi:hypothetical protein Cadr_000009910 [Camelus dromedarius]|uniref:Uncharacterized protein n=1 Tax=Camelus dromedarius TaxID=9838 RepID=A0A5N4DX90_CAMDR|nr:hypothetical protein Cadr_000009910 [Camelus dromedarius]